MGIAAPKYRLRLMMNDVELTGMDIPVSPESSEGSRVKLMFAVVRELFAYIGDAQKLNVLLTKMVWETIKHRGSG